MRKLIKFTDQNLQTHHNKTVQQYTIGEWVKPCDGFKSLKGNACGAGSLHLMKAMRPKYAPYPYLAHEAIGRGKLGEDDEKVRFREVKLIRTLSDQEINEGIDNDWTNRLGKAGLFLPISWVRTTTFLDRPVDTIECSRLLQGTIDLIGCNKPIKYLLTASSGASLATLLRDSLRSLLGDSLRDLLWGSLRGPSWDSLRDLFYDSFGNSLWGSLDDLSYDSLWDSLLSERGFELAGKPRQELRDLVKVWKMGACPVGQAKNSFIVLVKENKNEQTK